MEMIAFKHVSSAPAIAVGSIALRGITDDVYRQQEIVTFWDIYRDSRPQTTVHPSRLDDLNHGRRDRLGLGSVSSGLLRSAIVNNCCDTSFLPLPAGCFFPFFPIRRGSRGSISGHEGFHAGLSVGLYAHLRGPGASLQTPATPSSADIPTARSRRLLCGNIVVCLRLPHADPRYPSFCTPLRLQPLDCQCLAHDLPDDRRRGGFGLVGTGIVWSMAIRADLGRSVRTDRSGVMDLRNCS